MADAAVFDGILDVAGNGLYVRHSAPQPGRPTLVFLHDSLGAVSAWRDFPQRLADATRCNLLLYDRQGYGRSAPFGGTPRGADYLEREADVLQALLTLRGIGNALLFGHSDGGSIALIAASKYPDRISGVIAEAAHIFVEPITLDGIRAAIAQYQNTDQKERLARHHGDKTEALFHAWADTWLNPEYRHWTIEPLLPGVTCPVLILQGECDEYGSLKQVSGISGGIRGVPQICILPGIGHTPHKEAADATFAYAQRFINTFLPAK